MHTFTNDTNSLTNLADADAAPLVGNTPGALQTRHPNTQSCLLRHSKLCTGPALSSPNLLRRNGYSRRTCWHAHGGVQLMPDLMHWHVAITAFRAHLPSHAVVPLRMADIRLTFCLHDCTRCAALGWNLVLRCASMYRTLGSTLFVQKQIPAAPGSQQTCLVSIVLDASSRRAWRGPLCQCRGTRHRDVPEFEFKMYERAAQSDISISVGTIMA